MTDREIIQAAFAALAGYRDPSLLEDQRNQKLSRCWELLATAVYGEDEEEDEGR